MSKGTVVAISVLIGIVLLCIILMAIMVSRAMPYDPAWDEPIEKVVNYDDES